MYDEDDNKNVRWVLFGKVIIRSPLKKKKRFLSRNEIYEKRAKSNVGGRLPRTGNYRKSIFLFGRGSREASGPFYCGRVYLTARRMYTYDIANERWAKSERFLRVRRIPWARANYHFRRFALRKPRAPGGRSIKLEGDPIFIVACARARTCVRNSTEIFE